MHPFFCPLVYITTFYTFLYVIERINKSVLIIFSFTVGAPSCKSFSAYRQRTII